MSIREVFMPALSSTMTEGKIVSWVKSPGDKVEKGETVVVVESDKADMDVESLWWLSSQIRQIWMWNPSMKDILPTS